MQQHVVKHEEHDKALKKSWSSNASRLSSRRLDTVLPLDPARSGHEKEVDSVHLCLTIIQFTARYLNHIHTATASTHTQATQKALWRWASSEPAGEETLEARSCEPAHRWLGCIWSLSSRRKQYREFGSRTEWLSACFKTPGWLTAGSYLAVEQESRR